MSWLVFCITKLEVREVGCLPVQQWLLICEIGTCDRICAELHVVQKLPQLSPSVSGQFQEQSVFILVNISSTKQLYVIIKSYIGLRKECAILDILKLQLLVCHLLILLLNYTKFPFKVLGSWIRFFPPHVKSAAVTVCAKGCWRNRINHHNQSKELFIFSLKCPCTDGLVARSILQS